MNTSLKIATFLALCFVFFISCNKPANPVARQGIIDISSQSIKDHGFIKLDGEWEFYWQKLLSPADFDSTGKDGDFISVPDSWNGQTINGKEASKFGFGTYRLLIKTNPSDSILGLKIKRIDAACKIWINGILVAELGKVGSNAETSSGKWSNIERLFHTKNTTQELIIQVSNFKYNHGGITQPVTIADESYLNAHTKRSIGLDFLFLGIMLIVSIYHLILYILRRVIVSSLYFAILSFSASALLITSKNFGISFLLWPDIGLAVQFKLEYISYFISVVFLILFINSLFHSVANKKIIKGCLVFSLGMVVIISFLPIPAITTIMSVGEWLFILIIGYLLVVTIRALVNSIEGSQKSFLGLLLLFIAVLNDLLINKYLVDSYILLPFGFLAFILFQAYIISSQYTRAIGYSEQLTEEMDYLNNNLENLVKERTAKIEQQKEELEVQSESLKVANDEIIKINHILERQGGEMNKKNRALTDSLNYAKRLQTAVLPDAKELENLPEHFMFYVPKDIVSGDFYWYGEVDSSWDFDDANRIQVLIAADCTGHGVPGAFMTLLGHNFLNVTVITQQVIEPNEIIEKLDQQVVETLRQNDPSSIRDGMDIAVLSIDQDKNQISYAGAGIPLLIIKNGEIEEIKGSNFGIGGAQRKKTQFEKHKIEFSKGDMFYIFSDGYADQIGGKEGRKYYKKRFKEFLMEIKDNSMEEQKRLIEQEFFQWKGDYKQIDDILVIGLKM